MKKSKLFKTISFSSLALLMGAAGVFAFAPLGASPSVAGASEIETTTTETGGLIVPKKDDPIIYTTESGLEIKWGNAPAINNSLPSTGLAGFPYFSTSKDGTTYDWVIIGRNTNDTVFTSAITNYLFSNWKTNTNLKSSTYATKGYYFFNNTYESTTPAGSAINGVVPSKSYVADVTKVTKTVVGTDEVPSGCVLVWSNFYLDSNTTIYYNNGYLDSRDACFDGSLNTFKNRHVEYYSQDIFGFESHLSSIKSTSVNATNQWWNGSSWITVQLSTDLHFFPLASGRYANENFVITTYLTTNAQRADPATTKFGWPMLRSTHFGTNTGNGYQAADYWYHDGSQIWTNTGYNYHMLNANRDERVSRPAFVLKIT